MSINCIHAPDQTATDPAGPIENAMAKADGDYKCNAYLCRGYQYEDNASKAQAYNAGQVVHFYIDLVAAHKPGWAVSRPTSIILPRPTTS